MSFAVRTRFAPSPTGALHAGVVRTALFAWLLAKHSYGKFILRIEDTDQKREVEGSVKNIQESLKWLGLSWDEGPGIDNESIKYFQSQRLDIYNTWAKKLISDGRAYADSRTIDELDSLRQAAIKNKVPFVYRPTADGL